MTCLFNARAYRDGSAATPRRPDTSYWVLGCRGLVREHLVPHVQAAELPRRGTTCQGVPTAIAPLKEGLRESGGGSGVGPGWVRGRFLSAPFGIQLAVAICIASLASQEEERAKVLKKSSRKGNELPRGQGDERTLENRMLLI
jgi:hypothetical protein